MDYFSSCFVFYMGYQSLTLLMLSPSNIKQVTTRKLWCFCCHLRLVWSVRLWFGFSSWFLVRNGWEFMDNGFLDHFLSIVSQLRLSTCLIENKRKLLMAIQEMQTCHLIIGLLRELTFSYYFSTSSSTDLWFKFLKTPAILCGYLIIM